MLHFVWPNATCASHAGSAFLSATWHQIWLAGYFRVWLEWLDVSGRVISKYRYGG